MQAAEDENLILFGYVSCCFGLLLFRVLFYVVHSARVQTKNERKYP